MVGRQMMLQKGQIVTAQIHVMVQRAENIDQQMSLVVRATHRQRHHAGVRA